MKEERICKHDAFRLQGQRGKKLEQFFGHIIKFHQAASSRKKSG
jgi:hypothetical protein